MPDETIDTENIDPQQEQCPQDSNLSNITKLKGVSWQDGVDGKSLFTVSNTPVHSAVSHQRLRNNPDVSTSMICSAL